MKVRGPLADSYWASALLVITALVPFLTLSSALGPIEPEVMKGVGLSPQGLSNSLGMANAAYALGTVLAIQLAVLLPQRRMLVGYASMFTIGSVLAATAWTPGLFIAGHVIQGLFTSMMLIGAAPALVLGFPTSRLSTTVVVMNFGIFGAVAAGPLIGGLEAGSHAWRPLFWIVTGVGALALTMTLLTFTDTPAQNPDAARDPLAVTLAGLGCAAAFFGASELTTHSMLSLLTIAPLLAGAVLLITLFVYQTLKRAPLMPMKQLLTTFCVPGVIIAMAAGAAALPLIDIAQTALTGKTSAAHLGVLFIPFLGGAMVTGVLFGIIYRTKLMSVFAFSGMAAIIGGAAVLTGVVGGPHALVLVGSGLLGAGVGASVAPALFTVGFSLRAGELPQVFAMLELLRGAAAFAAGPIILHFATTVGGTPQAGLRDAVWLCFAIAAAGALVALYIFILGRPGLQAPDIAHWSETGEPAWHSPPLFAGIRPAAAIAGQNGHALLDPTSRTAARVEALAQAARLARGDVGDHTGN